MMNSPSTGTADHPILVVYLPHEWLIYHRRPHWQAAAALTTVLAVEPPVGALTFWRKFERLRSFWRHGWRVRRAGDNLWFVRPFSFMTYGVAHRLPWLAWLDRLLIGAQVRRAVHELRNATTPVAAFLVNVEQSVIAATCDADINCYEITDEYLVTPGHSTLDLDDPFTRRAARAEERILSKTDLIIASSVILRETRRTLLANTHYVPNSADFGHFHQACLLETPVPDEVAALPAPRLGFTGHMTDLIDVDLLDLIAATFPHCTLVLVGSEIGTAALKGSRGYRALKARSNVHFLGAKPYESLPGYLRGFDICLMPYRCNPWMKAASPNKTYQYLASGKPIVTVAFPEVEHLSDLLYVARTHEEFIGAIKRALGEHDPALVTKRQAVAKENTTASRAEKILKLVIETLQDKRSRSAANP